MHKLTLHVSIRTNVQIVICCKKEASYWGDLILLTWCFLLLQQINTLVTCKQDHKCVYFISFLFFMGSTGTRNSSVFKVSSSFMEFNSSWHDFRKNCGLPRRSWFKCGFVSKTFKIFCSHFHDHSSRVYLHSVVTFLCTILLWYFFLLRY